MNTETKNCQNCKADFIIDSDDFAFYDKLKVPPPTFCPLCRRMRRLAWTGYRMLYKRKCDSTGDNVISSFHPDVPYTTYRQDVWWSDKWDPKSYGRDYDFSRSFFEQFQDLMKVVPWPVLFTEYTTMIDSEYCNGAASLKNCYLCFKSDEGENNAYLNTTQKIKESYDVSYANVSELCYDGVTLNNCYQAFYSQDCDDCHNVYLSRDCVGCSNCFGCTGLRSKQYYIWNEPYSKEEYEKRIKELNLGSWKEIQNLKRKAQEVSLRYPRKAFHGRNAVQSSGDYLWNTKNARDCYMVMEGENLRYCELQKFGPLAECYDYTMFATKAEYIYESCWVGINVQNIKFGFWNYKSHDLEYCIGCHGSGNLFGCIGIRGGEYCIFNKQYTKEEYEDLVPKIREQMRNVPYRNARGLEYRYGEFFPIELCPWNYNESHAIEFSPLTKEEALAKHFTWREPDAREYQPATMEIADDIKEVSDDILKAMLACAACGKNYLIIKSEFEFYKRFTISIPRECPLCRDRARIGRLNPMALYDRTCAKCNKAIQTSYAPERPEIVYCEACYQAEVV